MAYHSVIPVKAELQTVAEDSCGVSDRKLDSRFRGNDGKFPAALGGDGGSSPWPSQADGEKNVDENSGFRLSPL